MSPRLWSAYQVLVKRYGLELMARLSEKLWRGPHGFEGKWTFKGEFLEF
jgi:hypothetical protein